MKKGEEMLKYVAPDVAEAKIAEFASGLLGRPVLDESGPTVEFTTGIFADDARVHVSQRRDGRSYRDSDGHLVTHFKYEATISWGATSRSLALARTALANYEKACVFAAQVQAFAEGLGTIADVITD
ncbi:hypothetical protein HYV22_03160 [Candidatus Gottesmanbacteria bacterium]|nr:hypothetical protein [Candidatus Gottesmanbacteria bacterium]